mmetsp:Transcript_15632/g.34371  ORF Transcript_15632/g.34371 Transcript_15632/m.34371 type:complete len:265 (-) Transcript_15632:976-1770(-)
MQHVSSLSRAEASTTQANTEAPMHHGISEELDDSLMAESLSQRTGHHGQLEGRVAPQRQQLQLPGGQGRQRHHDVAGDELGTYNMIQMEVHWRQSFRCCFCDCLLQTRSILSENSFCHPILHRNCGHINQLNLANVWDFEFCRNFLRRFDIILLLSNRKFFPFFLQAICSQAFLLQFDPRSVFCLDLFSRSFGRASHYGDAWVLGQKGSAQLRPALCGPRQQRLQGPRRIQSRAHRAPVAAGRGEVLGVQKGTDDFAAEEVMWI